jgi:hypothetical protein
MEPEDAMVYRQVSNLRLSYVAVIQDLEAEGFAVPSIVKVRLGVTEDLMQQLQDKRYLTNLKDRIGPGQASPL